MARRRPQLPAAPTAEFHAAYRAVLAQCPVAVESVKISSRYGRTHVNVCGPADGPPLVLLAGGGATSTAWFANLAELSRIYRVYAPDLIGDVGLSVPADRRLKTRTDLLDWLDGVVAYTGSASVRLAGHSYGAWVALSYAVRSPSRVAKLALLDPTLCFARLSPAYLLRAVPLLLRSSAMNLRRLYTWETHGVVINPAWLNLVSLGAEMSSGGLVRPVRPMAESLRASAVPTLVLLAGESRCHDIETVRVNARRLMPQVSTTVLADVSHHGLPMRHPDQLDRALLAFFGGAS